MANQIVAVEGELSPVADALRSAAFTVVPLTQQNVNTAAAIVVNGMDDNFLGMEDPQTASPVVDADGMTPEQVVAAVKRSTAIQQ